VCGIAVVHDFRPTPERLAAACETGERMLSPIAHRGPDGQGSRLVGSTWLGHTRLAIVDLAGGRQPMTSATGSTASGRWVAANGEIYNHDALRDELGGPFATSSDSEVILHVVATRGLEGVHDLKGMYAFAVAAEDSEDSEDGEDAELVLARDPLGV
jgi:asparagine synthase (glutamine-hydrolysing)